MNRIYCALSCLVVICLLCSEDSCGQERPEKGIEQLKSYLQKHKSFDQPGGAYSISVKEIEGNDLIDVEITVKREAKTYHLKSRRARLVEGKDKTLMIQFDQVEIESGDLTGEFRGYEQALAFPVFSKKK